MKRSLLVALLAAAACSDSGMEPDAAESISIQIDARATREAVVSAGDSLRLTVAFSSGNGSGNRMVAWRSEDPATARVGASGEDAATIHGEQPGSTRIIAEAGALADTIYLAVLSPTAAARDCGPEGTGLQLQIGETFTTTAAATSRLCLGVHPAGAEFILVPFNATSGAQSVQVEVLAEGLQASPPGVAANSIAAGGIAPGGIRRGRDLGAEFDRALREREARELGPMVVGSAGGSRPRFNVSAGAAPALGDTLILNVSSQTTCTSPVNRTARVMAVGSRAILLEDTTNPRDGFTAGDYQAISDAVDNLAYPTVTGAFGEPTDIDGNGRVMILFTRAVNEMTPAGAESYVAGFFYARDLFPRTSGGGLRGCAGSNQGEVLYLMVPDPTGEVNGNRRTRAFVAERTIGVVAHELQHLIGASRRLLVVQGQNWSEDFWLNEGLSHVAEELIFYAATQFDSRQNLNLSRLRNGGVALTRFNQYQATNFGRLISYLKAPGSSSPLTGNDLETRGAVWSFLRYAADRHGGTDGDLWKRFIDNDVTGYQNLMNALEVSPLTWMHDWAVSLYVDDLVSVAPAYRQPSWNSRSIIPSFSSSGGIYPLQVVGLGEGIGGMARLNLVSGGSAILRFRPATGARPALRTTSANREPPPEVRLILARVR